MPFLIVAVGRDGAIGRNGDLVWHISDDLKRFKRLTLGHPVIMGRKTWESLPKKPLPGRLNIVVSRQTDYSADGAIVVNSPDEAICMAEKLSQETPFVIGGANIYEAFLPKASKLFITEIDDICPDADALFPFPPDSGTWVLSEETPWQGQQPRFRFMTYENRTDK